MPKERLPAPDWEPSFENYRTARDVMVHVRKRLEAEGTKVSLSDDPVFGEIVFRGCALMDPSSFDSAGLSSAEGQYSASDLLAARKRRYAGKGEA